MQQGCRASLNVVVGHQRSSGGAVASQCRDGPLHADTLDNSREITLGCVTAGHFECVGNDST
jgi:hypothetical protein